MFFARLRQGSRFASWNTIAICGCGPVTSCPSSRMRPPESACSPATDHSSVDFPHPDGPMTQTNSPRRTSIENRSSATTRPLRVS